MQKQKVADWNELEDRQPAYALVANVDLVVIRYDDEVSFLAKRKIFDYARAGQGPFCLVVSYIHPHDPYVTRQRWWDLYDHGAIDLPGTTLAADDQDAFSKRLLAGIQADTVAVSEDQIRTARHAYYANISYFDSQVGELVATLQGIIGWVMLGTSGPSGFLPI